MQNCRELRLDEMRGDERRVSSSTSGETGGQEYKNGSCHIFTEIKFSLRHFTEAGFCAIYKLKD